MRWGAPACVIAVCLLVCAAVNPARAEVAPQPEPTITPADPARAAEPGPFAVPDHAAPPPEPPAGFLDHFELRHANRLELRYDRQDTAILGLPAKQNLESVWLFSNETLICNFALCNASSLVFRPRLTWQFAPATDPDFYFHELYLSVSAIPRLVVSVGSEVQGWGPGIFYSPTNRMFPETLFTTAVREPIRHKLVAVNVQLRPELTLFATAARADDSDFGAAPPLRSYFASARAEYQVQGEIPYTAGAVVGGGEHFQPYGGLYFEATLSDAWTVGSEFSTSSGYSRDRDPEFGAPGVFRNDDAWGFDGLINARYGLPSGGELGAELGVNEFALSDQAQHQLPTLYPLLLAGTHAGAGIPPVLDRRYAMVHGRLPDLPPGKRVTVSASLMYTNPSDSLIAAGELSVTPVIQDGLKAFVSFDLNFGPAASVQRFPFERFVRVGASFTY